jgi:choline-sulfatase
MWGKSNLYEETAGIPLIIAGEGVPEGKTSSTTTSLLDSYQTILDGVGLNETSDEQDLVGKSWFDLSSLVDDPDRIVFSEYHAASSPTGAYMLRKGKYKFIYYVDYSPELFDLEIDPEETTNLADSIEYEKIVKEYEVLLRYICDPEAVDRQAKEDQNILIEKFGGREKALNMGTPGATPVPGQNYK